MSWLQKLLPPKINRSVGGAGSRKTVPEGLWSKCAACPGKDKAGCLKAKICSILTADQKAKVGTACGA